MRGSRRQGIQEVREDLYRGKGSQKETRRSWTRISSRRRRLLVYFWIISICSFWLIYSECVWYGDVLCDGAVVEDLYRWWFLLKCSANKMSVVSRTWTEVRNDPRFKGSPTNWDLKERELHEEPSSVCGNQSFKWINCWFDIWVLIL